MAEVKKEAVKVTAKATPVEAVDKKETVKKPAARKPAAKRETVKKEVAKKVAVKETITLQYEDQNEQKTYTTEDLVGICKDVWKYDLKGRPSDLKNIELYVKPQENRVYYVINGDITGSFGI